MKAEIVAVGSELCTPWRSDTNSLWLTEQLNELGIEVQAKTIASDDLEVLVRALQGALQRCELVLCTGGLGPTEDDRTREAVARAVGRELLFHEELLEEIRQRFASRGLRMPDNNRRQAMAPEGARVLDNPYGTAPGLALEPEGRKLFVLPGPPREMKPMFWKHVRPELERQGVQLRRRTLRVNGLGESALDERIAHLYKHLANPSTTILFTDCDIEIHLAAQSEDPERAEAMLDELAGQLAKALGEHVYTTRGETLAEVVLEGLRRRNLTLAAAESCTGGMVAERLTRYVGAGDIFRGGLVTYATDCKIGLLGLDPELIERHSVYSHEVARAMAELARERVGSDVAVGITGVAGPTGGNEENPVGTVYVGIAGPAGVESRRLNLIGDRQQICARATQSALDWVRLRYANGKA